MKTFLTLLNKLKSQPILTFAILSIVIIGAGGLFLISSEKNEDPLKKILFSSDVEVNEMPLRADLLTSSLSRYSGAVPASVQGCMANFTNTKIEPNKVIAQYNPSFDITKIVSDATQSMSEIRSEIREKLMPVFGHAVLQNPPQINWRWDSRSRMYTFHVYEGDEVFWHCYFNESTQFFKEFFSYTRLEWSQLSKIHDLRGRSILTDDPLARQISGAEVELIWTEIPNANRYTIFTSHGQDRNLYTVEASSLSRYTMSPYTAGLSARVRDLDFDQEYKFSVVAIDSNKEYIPSNISGEISVSTFSGDAQGKPPSIRDLQLVGNELQWTAPHNVSEYKISYYTGETSNKDELFLGCSSLSIPTECVGEIVSITKEPGHLEKFQITEAPVKSFVVTYTDTSGKISEKSNIVIFHDTEEVSENISLSDIPEGVTDLTIQKDEQNKVEFKWTNQVDDFVSYQLGFYTIEPGDFFDIDSSNYNMDSLFVFSAKDLNRDVEQTVSTFENKNGGMTFIAASRSENLEHPILLFFKNKDGAIYRSNIVYLSELTSNEEGEAVNSSLTVALDSSTPPEDIIIANSDSTAEVAKFKFTATHEPFVVKKISIQNGLFNESNDNEILDVKIDYTNSSGAHDTKTGYLINGIADFSNLDFYIAKDDATILTIFITPNTIAGGADSGDKIKLGIADANFEAVGQNSSETITNPGFTGAIYGNSMTIRKTVPTVAKANGLTTSLSGGQNVVYAFTVGADNANSVSWSSAKFRVTGIFNSDYDTLNDFKFYRGNIDVTDDVHIVVDTITTDTTGNLAVGDSLEGTTEDLAGNGAFDIVASVEWNDAATAKETIPERNSKTYYLKANVAGANSADSISAYISDFWWDDESDIINSTIIKWGSDALDPSEHTLTY